MTKPRKPEALGTAVSSWLAQKGLAPRVEQAGIIPEWDAAVGPQIASVTSPTSVTADGTLFVQVSTNAWMTELSLMEPELLRTLNARGNGAPILRIRWQIRR